MEKVVRSVDAMGTRLSLEVTASDRATALAASQAAIEAVEAAEARLSTWRPGSELDRLNLAAVGEWVEVSSELARDLSVALDWAALTDGAFDPVLGSLVIAWDLRGRGAIPDEDRLADLREKIGYRLVEVEDQWVRLLEDGAIIEEGGFGKGAALRDATAAATEAGASCLRMDFGGQLVVTPDCGPERIQVADPRHRHRVVGEIVVEGRSVATSGNSERGLDKDGRRIGHLLDPRSGLPAPDWGSVTVVADDPFDADCLATALFVMGPIDGPRWLDGVDGIDAVFLIVAPGGSVEMRATRGIDFRNPKLSDSAG